MAPTNTLTPPSQAPPRSLTRWYTQDSRIMKQLYCEIVFGKDLFQWLLPELVTPSVSFQATRNKGGDWTASDDLTTQNGDRLIKHIQKTQFVIGFSIKELNVNQAQNQYGSQWCHDAFWSKFGNLNFYRWWVMAWTSSRGVNFDSEVQFDLEVKWQSPHKTIWVLTKGYETSDLNVEIIAWTADELLRGQASDGHRNGHTQRQMQAMTILVGQNWHRGFGHKENIDYENPCLGLKSWLRSKFWVTKLSQLPTDSSLFSMSIGHPFPGLRLFSKYDLDIYKVYVIAKGGLVGPMFYRLASLSSLVNRSSCSWYTAFSKFVLQILCQCHEWGHKMGRLPICSHPFHSMLISPSQAYGL